MLTRVSGRDGKANPRNLRNFSREQAAPLIAVRPLVHVGPPTRSKGGHADRGLTLPSAVTIHADWEGTSRPFLHPRAPGTASLHEEKNSGRSRGLLSYIQETIDEASEGLELPKQDYPDHCFVFSHFLMYVLYKRAPLFNEKAGC